MPLNEQTLARIFNEVPHAPGIKPPAKNGGMTPERTTRNMRKLVRVAKFMAQGYSLPASCGKAKVSYSSLTRWVNDHPDFKERIDMAKLERMAVFEERMMGESTKMPQIVAAIFALKNIDPEVWQEKPAYQPGLSQNITIITGVPEKPADNGKVIEAKPVEVITDQNANDRTETGV